MTQMFEVQKIYSGHVYYPNISKINYQLINPSLFTSFNPVGNIRILRDCDEHLRSAKGSPLVTQAGSGAQTSLVQLCWGWKEKIPHWRVSICRKGNVTAHTFGALGQVEVDIGGNIQRWVNYSLYSPCNYNLEGRSKAVHTQLS